MIACATAATSMSLTYRILHVRLKAKWYLYMTRAPLSYLSTSLYKLCHHDCCFDLVVWQHCPHSDSFADANERYGLSIIIDLDMSIRRNHASESPLTQ